MQRQRAHQAVLPLVRNLHTQLSATSSSATSLVIRRLDDNTQPTTARIEVRPTPLTSSTSSLPQALTQEQLVSSDALIRSALEWRSEKALLEHSSTYPKLHTSTAPLIESLEEAAASIARHCELACLYIKQGNIRDARDELGSAGGSLVRHLKREKRKQRHRLTGDVAAPMASLLQEHNGKLMEAVGDAVYYLVQVQDIDSLEKVRKMLLVPGGVARRTMGTTVATDAALLALDAIMKFHKATASESVTGRPNSSRTKSMDIENKTVDRLSVDGVMAFTHTVAALQPHLTPILQMRLRTLWERHNPTIIYRSSKYEGGVFNVKDNPQVVLPPSTAALLYSESANACLADGAHLRRDCGRFEAALASFEELSPSLVHRGRLPSHFHTLFTVPAIKASFLTNDKVVMRKALHLARKTSLSFPRDDVDAITTLFEADMGAATSAIHTQEEWDAAYVHVTQLANALLLRSSPSPRAALRKYAILNCDKGERASGMRRGYLRMALMVYTAQLKLLLRTHPLKIKQPTRMRRLQRRLGATFKLACNDPSLAAERADIVIYSWLLATKSEGAYETPFWAKHPATTRAAVLSLSECLRSLEGPSAHRTVFAANHPIRAPYGDLKSIAISILRNNFLDPNQKTCIPFLEPQLEADLMGAYLAAGGKLGAVRTVLDGRPASMWMAQWARLLSSRGYTEEAVQNARTRSVFPFLKVPSPSALKTLWSITVRPLQPPAQSGAAKPGSPPRGSSAFASLFLRQFALTPNTPSRRDYGQRPSKLIAEQISVERSLRQQALVGMLSCCVADSEVRAVAGALSGEDTQIGGIVQLRPAIPSTATTQQQPASLNIKLKALGDTRGEQGCSRDASPVQPQGGALDDHPLSWRIRRMLRCEGLEY